MPATIKGFGFNEVKAQPGFTARQGENGGWTGRHTFSILKTAWSQASVRAQFQKGTSITALDPGLESWWSFMGVVEAEVVSEEGGFYLIGVDVAGGLGAQYNFEDDGLSGTATPTYRLRGQLAQAPLSEHPKWIALTALQKEALEGMLAGGISLDRTTDVFGYRDDAQNFYAFEAYDGIATGDCLEFAKIIASGENSYERPAFTWTETTEGTSGLTEDQINKLGHVSTPRGSPPTPNGSRNWKLTGAYQEESGDKRSTDIEWTLSERGGHNAFLYT